ncbi:hypothetical protein A3F34_00770 [Candidatus Roizmanbacteria bacterium RIFCSPHIGHO2_12_FULL_44_10]|uniref:Uncharacterized protein n=1 Tax=Candidatus Roizmanbacteria bacterium RIFCSPHIGHO2_12_FULL_44_10 TaxID=1802054 RepID=A0A1F7I873_9BACT|nr:MAG: hypothetical protein A3F34_00770 [Candidatus Roizmanbacteria bacterium RIFCSPHIGHO2_12_FULL_44_10]
MLEHDGVTGPYGRPVEVTSVNESSTILAISWSHGIPFKLATSDELARIRRITELTQHLLVEGTAGAYEAYDNTDIEPFIIRYFRKTHPKAKKGNTSLVFLEEGVDMPRLMGQYGMLPLESLFYVMGKSIIANMKSGAELSDRELNMLSAMLFSTIGHSSLGRDLFNLGIRAFYDTPLLNRHGITEESLPVLAKRVNSFRSKVRDKAVFHGHVRQLRHDLPGQMTVVAGSSHVAAITLALQNRDNNVQLPSWQGFCKNLGQDERQTAVAVSQLAASLANHA